MRVKTQGPGIIRYCSDMVLDVFDCIFEWRQGPSILIRIL